MKLRKEQISQWQRCYKKSSKKLEIGKFNISTINIPLSYRVAITISRRYVYTINSNLFELESFHSLKPFTNGETFS